MPIKYELPNAPFTEVRISLIYNKAEFPSNILWIDSEFSQETLSFSYDITYHYVSFCTSYNIPNEVNEIEVIY